ncbi:YppF family protein [Bacillus dakarensis]|uniref:YppF family protein n=1 Tax=Robertmurraya dakarensis TaxID=1926278 RepID=UPI000980ADA4|nr:YppF family protein [Bacillus dakarensis]
MLVHELMEKFSLQKNYSTENVNALLDFAKKAYIFNEITTRQYKNIVRELESLGAKIPDDLSQNLSLIESNNQSI